MVGERHLFGFASTLGSENKKPAAVQRVLRTLVTLLGLLRVPGGLRIPRHEARPPRAASLFGLRPLVRKRATA